MLFVLTGGTKLAQDGAQLPNRRHDPPTPLGFQGPVSSEFLGTAVPEPARLNQILGNHVAGDEKHATTMTRVVAKAEQLLRNCN